MGRLKSFLAQRTIGEMTVVGIVVAIIVFALAVQFGGGLALIEDLARG